VPLYTPKTCGPLMTAGADTPQMPKARDFHDDHLMRMKPRKGCLLCVEDFDLELEE
jgi:hypothetical protein